MSTGNIVILCGDSGSGKTTLLLKMIEKLKGDKLVKKGILSPAVFQDARKTGINMLDVFTGEERTFAAPNDSGETYLSTRGWKMDPKTMEYAKTALQQATPCDILFVDELGPLEFDRGEGLIEGFPSINSRAYQLALVTIRPILLEKARALWPDAKVSIVTRDSQDALISEILELTKSIQ